MDADGTAEGRARSRWLGGPRGSQRREPAGRVWEVELLPYVDGALTVEALRAALDHVLPEVGAALAAGETVTVRVRQGGS